MPAASFSVNFSKSNANLTTVGYRLGPPVSGRTTEGVHETAPGIYEVTVPYPPACGYILWDNGTVAERLSYAVEEINPTYATSLFKVVNFGIPKGNLETVSVTFAGTKYPVPELLPGSGVYGDLIDSPGTVAQGVWTTGDSDPIHAPDDLFSFFLSLPANPSFQEALLLTLLDDPTLGQLVGTRMFPVNIPQSVPYRSSTLVYRYSGVDRSYHLNGSSGICSANVEFEIRSGLHGETQHIMWALEDLLERVRDRGEMLGVRIFNITIPDEVDDYEQPVPGSDYGTHMKTTTFRFRLPECFLHYVPVMAAPEPAMGAVSLLGDFAFGRARFG